MIGEIVAWSAARNSGTAKPVGEPADLGWYVHGGAFGNRPLPIGTRIAFDPWVAQSGMRMATNARLVTAETEEVYRALG